MSNIFGRIFTLTSFGESHGVAIGGVIDGCPSNIEIDLDFVQNELNRRRPGRYLTAATRNEEDKVEFLSGIFEGRTTGVPIAFIIRNNDAKSKDYELLKNTFRPSHADFTYCMKYGIRDYRGGGRSSARETAVRVAAGAIAKQILNQIGISITAYTSQIGHISIIEHSDKTNLNHIGENEVFCPDQDIAEKMVDYLKELKQEGDTVGGIVSCTIRGVPIAWGEPVFDKLHARLGQAMLSIPAAHGFDYGAGFNGVGLKGSELNDSIVSDGGKVKTITNHSGGIQGGISNGEDIYFRVLFKPIPTISQKQNTVDIHGNNVELEVSGRHDTCVIPRVIPVVEAMAALTLVDFYLLNNKK